MCCTPESAEFLSGAPLAPPQSLNAASWLPQQRAEPIRFVDLDLDPELPAERLVHLTPEAVVVALRALGQEDNDPGTPQLRWILSKPMDPNSGLVVPQPVARVIRGRVVALATSQDQQAPAARSVLGWPLPPMPPVEVQVRRDRPPREPSPQRDLIAGSVALTAYQAAAWQEATVARDKRPLTAATHAAALALQATTYLRNMAASAGSVPNTTALVEYMDLSAMRSVQRALKLEIHRVKRELADCNQSGIMPHHRDTMSDRLQGLELAAATFSAAWQAKTQVELRQTMFPDTTAPQGLLDSDHQALGRVA